MTLGIRSEIHHGELYQTIYWGDNETHGPLPGPLVWELSHVAMKPILNRWICIKAQNPHICDGHIFWRALSVWLTEVDPL